MSENSVTHEDLHARLSVVEDKLEDIAGNVTSLVELKNKGAGVLWVASIIASSLFTTLVYYLGSFFNGSPS